MKVLRELIWTQKYEIAMMIGELKHKTENISEITNNQPFIPTVSSFIYPNVIGLTNTYCDPSFFESNTNHMGFAINKKIADKKTASNAKTNVQAGGSSKFIAKASTKSSGASKKPIKTGGSRGS